LATVAYALEKSIPILAQSFAAVIYERLRLLSITVVVNGDSTDGRVDCSSGSNCRKWHNWHFTSVCP